MDYFTIYESKIGNIYLTSDGTYLTSLLFDLKNKDKYIRKNLEIFNKVKEWLNIYFSNKCPNFKVEYKINNLTPFRKLVFDLINKIPYGSVTTYNDIAKEIAKIKNIKKMSAQAVGRAVG